MSTVDIIIPLYNKERTVSRAIQSIIEQTFSDWRLIIVDDGSTDQSLHVAREFQNSRIQFIEQENRGPGAARNRGIKEATAPYLAFLDADDQWYPSHLDNAIGALQDKTVSFVGAMYEDHPEPGDMSAFWAKRNVVPGIYMVDATENPKDILSKLFFFHVGNSVVRTEIARRYGGFYERDKCLLGEDTVFFAKLLFNEPFEILESVGVRHHRRDSVLSTLKDRPLDIFLRKPEIILDYCRDESRPFVQKILDWHALRVAHFRARNGQKEDAIFLKNHFPGMREFHARYRQLCMEIVLSRWLPYWVRLKCRMAGIIHNLGKADKG